MVDVSRTTNSIKYSHDSYSPLQCRDFITSWNGTDVYRAERVRVLNSTVPFFATNRRNILLITAFTFDMQYRSKSVSNATLFLYIQNDKGLSQVSGRNLRFLKLFPITDLGATSRIQKLLYVSGENIPNWYFLDILRA